MFKVFAVVCICVVVLFLIQTLYLVSPNRTALRASFVIQTDRASFIESPYCTCGAYVTNVWGERCQVHKLGEIKWGLWEKLKLALDADFLILCISSRYCLCVSKCTLLHKWCSFYFIFYFFRQPRLCSWSRTLGREWSCTRWLFDLFDVSWMCKLLKKKNKKLHLQFLVFNQKTHSFHWERTDGCVFT